VTVAAPEARLAAAMAAIDEANQEDPHCLEIDGVQRPKELVHAEMMTAWVRRLDPDATEAQLLAARAHHLRRWVVPRNTYPEGRAGYLRWRADQKKRHAIEVAEILHRFGYEQAVVERVQQIVRKEGLRHDPDVQVHEDALCLVFLETQLSATTARLGEQPMMEVLVKTLAKMSDAGKQAASTLSYEPSMAVLVQRAVQEHGATTDG